MDDNQIIGELKNQGIDLVCSIPCDKAKGLFYRIPDEFRHIGLTREEDGVGISAGAYLAGARPAIAIQSSGLGNMLNAILSLTVTFGLPLPISRAGGGAMERRSQPRFRSIVRSRQSLLRRGLPVLSSPGRMPLMRSAGPWQQHTATMLPT